MIKRNKYRHNRTYLEKKGFDGFCNPSILCGCDFDDLLSCGGEWEAWKDSNCRPGYRHKDGLMYLEKEGGIMAKTNISWATDVWNVTSGCTSVSEGCKNCYARTMALRLQAMGIKGYEKGFEVTLHPERLDEPFKWKKPRKVFVCSMGDLFHENVPDKFINDVWYTMSFNPHHIFMILTKRPGRAREIARAKVISGAGIKPNIWLGVTAENQEQADKRIPILLSIPAAKRFVSVEPCIERVTLQNLHGPEPRYLGRFICTNCGDEPPGFECNCCTMNTEVLNLVNGKETSRINWVICGCESGPNRRLFNEDWARDLRDQCKVAAVPFSLKQIPINGHVSHDMSEWPEDLCIRETP